MDAWLCIVSHTSKDLRDGANTPIVVSNVTCIRQYTTLRSLDYLWIEANLHLQNIDSSPSFAANSLFSLISATATFHPRFTRDLTRAIPMPLLPPVTIATRDEEAIFVR
jgi:hypothetical protein